MTDPKELRKYLQQSHDKIFESNRKWAEEQKEKNPEFFEKLSQGQEPDYLWIGVSFFVSSNLFSFLRFPSIILYDCMTLNFVMSSFFIMWLMSAALLYMKYYSVTYPTSCLMYCDLVSHIARLS
jgi:hypothetical protein